MRKLLLLLLPFILCVSWLPAQSIPLREIDFSDARVSLAGPRQFYLRDVGFQGERYALRIGQNEEGTWVVTDLYGESENIAPKDLILDFATIQLEGENTLLLDGIFVDGTVYQGRLRIGDEDTAQIADGFTPGNLEAIHPERLRELRSAILELAAPEYEARIDGLQGELAESREQLLQQEQLIEELLSENNTLESELEERELRIAELQESITTLEEELAQLSAATDRPSAAGETTEEAGPSGEATATNSAGREGGSSAASLDLSRLERDVRALREEARGIVEAMRELQAENERLVRDNERLRVALEEARERADERAARDEGSRDSAIVASPATPGTEEIATATDLLEHYRRQLSRVTLNGFSEGSARMGSWRIDENLAIQDDPGEYFSRYALPLEQSVDPTLFSFTGRSLDPQDWTGFGIHLFASDVNHPNGYGHGESLLIWFTRDPETYGTDLTYLQVYRSSNDVSMDRVAGGIIPEPITSPLDIDVLYQPEVGDITIAVHGEVKLLYKGWFGIEDGMEIALRTKGRGRFENLRIRTTPE